MLEECIIIFPINIAIYKISYHGSWYLILGYIMSFFLCKILLRVWLRNRNMSKCATRISPIFGCCNLRLYGSWLRHKSCAVMKFMARIFLNVNENKIWLKLKCRKLDDMKCCNADKQELTIACFVGLVHWSIFFNKMCELHFLNVFAWGRGRVICANLVTMTKLHIEKGISFYKAHDTRE